jgi:hypothetical protein
MFVTKKIEMTGKDVLKVKEEYWSIICQSVSSSWLLVQTKELGGKQGIDAKVYFISGTF